MKVMVIGGGGREHAIIKKLKESKEITELYALPGNGGIAEDAVCVNIGATDIAAQVKFATENKIDYAVVAPDDPLCLGAVDELTKAGIPCFGPDKKAAIIEGSKVFSKNLMKKYGIPSAAYEVFDNPESALAYLETAPLPTVIKADGLALGKGVIIAETREDAKRAVRDIMEDKVLIYTLYATLNDMEREMMEYKFIRIHQSFLVNLKHIKSITGYSVILNNNQKLVVPRARYKDVKSAFIAYKGEV